MKKYFLSLWLVLSCSISFAQATLDSTKILNQSVVSILTVTSDPSVSPGIAATKGSIAIAEDTGILFNKFSASATSWQQFTLGPSGANTALSNLITTSVNQSLIPSTAGTKTLGNSTDYWGSSSIFELEDASGNSSVNPFNRHLYDASVHASVSWSTRQLTFTDGTTVMFDWSAAGILNASTNQISNVVDPTHTQDAATKNYIDTITTLPDLSLPTSQLTGTLAIANGGTNNSSPYTAGSVIFSNGTSLTQNNANFFWNNTNFSLGLATATPATNTFIDGVNSSGATKRIQVTGYGNNTGFRGRYANGTVGSPTAAVSANVLSFLSAQGYGATGFSATSTALINMTAAATFTDSSMPTDVNILTTPTGSTTAVQTVLFSHTGATTLGAASSTAVHQINGGLNVTTRTTTGNLTIDTTTSDYLIFANCSATCTMTMPAPTNGRILIFKDISGTANTNNILIAQHASEMIEGIAATKTLQTNWGSWTFSSDGTNWFIVGM